ncbi:MAG: hypothetical protein KJ955_05480 [Nanoarchaeota archaeon]|nr:hypothetical protein [Nanoarchaeota archaeon]
MDEEKKSGYIAGGIFLLVGILVSVVGVDSGWYSGKITIIAGLFLTLLGVGGVWKPGIIGPPLAHYLKQLSEKQERATISQRQGKYSKGIQAIAKDGSKISFHKHYYKSKLPERKIVDEKEELIKEIKKELTIEKLSNILIKCIRLAKITHAKKDLEWLENEARGFKEEDKHKLKKDIPNYRTINTEIRIASTAESGYTSINYKLALGQPIFEIEGWIDSYESRKTSGEFILWGERTEHLKKAYKEVLHREPPEEAVPYITNVIELKRVLNGLRLRIGEFISSID